MHNPSILVVEDQQVVALDLRERLSELGYTVPAIVGSGREAVREAKRLSPDLVLLDIRLDGDMDGISAAEAIHADSTVPVVYVTAYSDDETLERAKVTQPYGFVLKPVETRELHAAVEIALYRHAMQRKLEASEALSAATIHCVADAVLTADEMGSVTSLNPLAEYVTGWSESDARGLPYTHVLKSAEVKRLLRTAALPANDVPRSGEESVLTTRGGAVRDVEMMATPLRGAHGESFGTVWAFRDITERKRLQDAQRLMAEVSARLAALLDGALGLETVAELAVPTLADWCVIDVVAANSAIRPVAVVHGQPRAREGLVQRLALRRTPVATRDYGVAHVMASRTSELCERVPDNAWLSTALGLDPFALGVDLAARSWICVPLIARGQVLGAVTLVSERPDRRYGRFELSIAEDLGRRIAMALDNARLYREARQAIRLREDILAIASHDLRDPLTSVSLNADFALHLGADPDRIERVRERLRAIRRAALQMGHLVDDLLDVSRIEQGQLSIEQQRASAATLIREVLGTYEPIAAGKSIALTSQELPENVFVSCDRDRIVQVLASLVGNAIKFTPVGGLVTVRLEARGGSAIFTITDTGPGISPERLQHLFDPYWQYPEAMRDGGLGLYVSRVIVEGHGGRIWTASTEQQGSIFCFSLPLAEERSDENSPRRAAGASGA